jgi:hypothetical protein
MQINLAYVAAAILLLVLAFLRDYNVRHQEKLAQKDCVKELLTQFFAYFPYNQYKMHSLRAHLSLEMWSKYEQMRLDGYQMIDIQLEIRRDADRFLKENM